MGRVGDLERLGDCLIDLLILEGLLDGEHFVRGRNIQTLVCNFVECSNSSMRLLFDILARMRALKPNLRGSGRAVVQRHQEVVLVLLLFRLKVK